MAKVTLYKGGNAVSIPVCTCSKQDINAIVSHTENYNGLDWTVTKVTGSSGGFTSVTIGAYTGPTPPLSAADGILAHFNIPCSNLAGSDISHFETVGGSSTYSIYTSGNPSFGDTYVADGDGTVKTVGCTLDSSNHVSLSGNNYGDTSIYETIAGFLVCPKDENSAYIGIIRIQNLKNTINPTGYGVNSFIIDIKVSVDPINDIAVVGKGEPGFHPIGNHTRDTIGGGDDSGDLPGYGSDVLTQPGAPDESVASAVGSGFLNIYQVSQSALDNFGKCLFSSTLATAIANLFINPMDAVVSLQVFPCSPNAGGAYAIKVLNHYCNSEDLGVDAFGAKLSNQFKTFDFGTLYVAEMWKSFLDYDASSFTLYLPFIGSVDIPVNEVMNGSINVQYTVDFLTGMCVANVLCTKNTTLSDGTSHTQYAQHSYMGNCSVQIPVTSNSYGNIVGSLVNAASAGLKSGMAGAAGSLAMSIAGGGFKPTVETKGTIGANAGFCSILQPYITVVRPVPAEPVAYQEVMGYPSYITNRLGDCVGLCVCDDINLSSVAGATENELKRIKALCKEGVYV